MTIMKSERMVKWSKEALDFWEESPDNSVTLQSTVSEKIFTEQEVAHFSI